MKFCNVLSLEWDSEIEFCGLDMEKNAIGSRCWVWGIKSAVVGQERATPVDRSSDFLRKQYFCKENWLKI
jgi:hypothetical protein